MNQERAMEGISRERRERTPTSAYDEAIHDPEVYDSYAEEISGIIKELQRRHDDLSFPLTEKQRTDLVCCYQIALDRGQCWDSDQVKQDWVHDSLRSFREDFDHRNERPAAHQRFSGEGERKGLPSAERDTRSDEELFGNLNQGVKRILLGDDPKRSGLFREVAFPLSDDVANGLNRLYEWCVDHGYSETELKEAIHRAFEKRSRRLS